MGICCKRGEVLEQEGDVLLALAQGRDRQLDDRKPVIKIRAEAAGAARLAQVDLTGRDRAQIDRVAAIGPEPFDDPLLQRAQQLSLDRERHTVDLVEEKRAPAGVLELPDPSFCRAGEGAGLVSEQLAFRHRLRDGGAIDGYVVPLMTPPEVVQATRHEVLAGPGLTENDDADVGCGKLGDARTEPLDGLRGAHDARAKRLLRYCAPEAAVFRDELALFGRVPDDLQQALRLEGLLDEVVGPKPHGVDGGLDIAVPGYDDDGQLRIDVLRLAQKLHAVGAFHLEVGHQNAGKVRAQGCYRGRGAVVDDQLEAGKAQPLADGLTHGFLVVDKQHQTLVRHGSPLQLRAIPRRNAAAPQ